MRFARRFASVGAAVTLLDLGLVLLGARFTDWPLPVVDAVAIVVATFVSYWLHRAISYAAEPARRWYRDLRHYVMAGFLALAANTPARAVSTLRTQLHEVLRGAAQLESVIEQKDRRTGPGGPSGGLRDLRAAVAAVLGVLTQLPQLMNEPAEPPLPMASAAATASTPTLPEPSAPAPAALSPARGPIRSRAEAYQRLTEAAEFLLATEPHSPVPYLVRRAVSWGGMSLGQLLDELVQEDSDRRAIFTLLAMREPRS